MSNQNITVFGAGYVGLVTANCLAKLGHSIVCIDVNQYRVDNLNQGQLPIYEPGLAELLSENLQNSRIQFTTNIQQAVDHGSIQFIAVGTPPDEDGSADLQYVLAVARSIGEHMNNAKIVIDKSTVPVGTAAKVKHTVQQALQARSVDFAISVVSNPEFLREGHALSDFMQPDRVVIGVDQHDEFAKIQLEQLYAPITNPETNPLLIMDIASAELTKYAANSMLATKISFINEMSQIAERIGADIEAVADGIGLDQRIGRRFLNAGCGYGGSCFPKDVKALIRSANNIDYQPELLEAVERVNQKQKQVLFSKINNHYQQTQQSLKNKIIAVWGLAFKPHTDDMREASSRELMQALWAAGAKIQAFDPEAQQECQRIYGERDDLAYYQDQYTALENADALVIVTEWDEFKNADIERIQHLLKDKVIFDGRNLFDLVSMRAQRINYISIGREAIIHVD